MATLIIKLIILGKQAIMTEKCQNVEMRVMSLKSQHVWKNNNSDNILWTFKYEDFCL